MEKKKKKKKKHETLGERLRPESIQSDTSICMRALLPSCCSRCRRDSIITPSLAGWRGVSRFIRATNIFLTTLRFFHFSLRLLFFLPLSSRLCATRPRAHLVRSKSVVSLPLPRLPSGRACGGRTE